MKSSNLILGTLVLALAFAVTAWKLFPESSGDSPSESTLQHSQSKSKSTTSPSGFTFEKKNKPDFTKKRERLQAKKSPQSRTNNLALRHNPLTESLRVTARENLLKSPLPTPAVFIALDPSVSRIPAAHEPAVQSMAEDAAKIIEGYETAVEQIEKNTTLAPADKESALIALREETLNGVKSIDYQFRAKYGARAWMAHHIAAHWEFNQEK
jgi:hypothetical protein